MPKGKRGIRDYEREIEEAAKRFRKYPESLYAANSSSQWIKFLKSIGVYEHSIQSGYDFFESVREKTIEIQTASETEYGVTARQLAEASATVEKYERAYGEQVIFRGRSGRFISKKDIIQ